MFAAFAGWASSAAAIAMVEIATPLRIPGILLQLRSCGISAFPAAGRQNTRRVGSRCYISRRNDSSTQMPL